MSPPTNTALRLGSLQTQLLACLWEQNLEAAGAFFERLMGVPWWLEQGFQLLHSRIKAEPHSQRNEAALLEMLLQRSDISFKYLKLIARILELSAATDQENTIYEKISALAADERAPPPRFSNLDFISHISRLGAKNLRLIALLKYKGTHRFDHDDIPEIASDLARRLDLAPSLEERLYVATRFSQCPREEWTAKVKQAFAIDAILADRLASFNLLSDNIEPARTPRLMVGRDLLDLKEVTRGFKGLNPALGTLVTGFHGGFINLICDAFRIGTKNGLFMARVAGPNFISNQDPKAALFHGVRSVLDGQSIFIAADARAGKYNSTIRILDVDVPVADGAPFIAYETNCETIWLGVERSRNGFAPVFVEGPSRRDGERFVEFRERWLSFYSYQINRVLTGSPRDLTLRLQWATLFSKRLDPSQSVV